MTHWHGQPKTADKGISHLLFKVTHTPPKDTGVATLLSIVMDATPDTFILNQ
jgi:hypothetical protein